MAFSTRFKQSLVAGLIVVLPLLVSGFVLVWLAQVIEGLMSPVLAWLLGTRLPGLGFVSALVIVTVIGLVATTVLGGRLLSSGERLVARIPLFKDIYVPVKQLVTAFSPENEAGFKRVVLVSHPRGGGMTLGFMTREFEVEDEDLRMRPWVAVYVPTNHLYLGDMYCYPKEELVFPDLSVEEGARIVLTGGTAFPRQIRRQVAGIDSKVGTPR